MSAAMSVSPHGSFASFVMRPVVRLLAERGVDPDAFLARFGDDRPEILRTDGRVDLAVIARLLDELSVVVGEPAVGLSLARRTDYASFGPLGVAFAAGGRLRDVFTLCSRYSTIVTDAIDVRYEEAESITCIALDVQPGMSVHPQALVLALALTQDFVRARVGRLRPSRVCVCDVDAAGRAAIGRYFDCPVDLDRGFRIEFPNSVGGAVLAGSDPEIAAAIERTLDARIERDGTRLVDELRIFVETNLSVGHPSLDEAADAFGTTPRSLQRRLKERRTSWQVVVDETRRRIAGRFVSESPMSFTEIATRLGFADLSSFSRSFRKWYGVSARSFRSSSTQRRPAP